MTELLNLLADMFATPGTPAGPYERMAAAVGHGMVGVIAFSLLVSIRAAARNPRLTAGLVVAVYAVLWEGAQIALSGSSWADSAIDVGAVGMGAFIAVQLWSRRPLPNVIAAAFLIALGTMRPGKDRANGR